tara:strand:- start:663 stop:872 length:210 start_codon:yes stop_codon:yes gene_type:complete
MLKDFLNSSGLSQRAFAEQVGIDPSYLSLLVSGQKRPSLKLAVSIEKATGGKVPCVSWVPDPTAAEDAA